MGNCDDPVGLEQRSGLAPRRARRRVDPPAAAATRRTTGPNATTVGEQSSRRGDERAVVHGDDGVCGRRRDLIRAVDHVGAREQLRERSARRGPTIAAPGPRARARASCRAGSVSGATAQHVAARRRRRLAAPSAGSSASTKRPMPVRGPTSGVASTATRIDATLPGLTCHQTRSGEGCRVALKRSCPPMPHCSRSFRAAVSASTSATSGAIASCRSGWCDASSRSGTRAASSGSCGRCSTRCCTSSSSTSSSRCSWQRHPVVPDLPAVGPARVEPVRRRRFRAATGSIIDNGSLVKKVWFPREILPLASVGAALVHFCLQSLVLFAAIAIVRYPVPWAYVWLIVPGSASRCSCSRPRSACCSARSASTPATSATCSSSCCSRGSG